MGKFNCVGYLECIRTFRELRNLVICVLTPVAGPPPQISAYTLCFRKLESSAYILPLIVWVYLYSNFSDGPRKTFFVSTRVTFRPFKVIQGH